MPNSGIAGSRFRELSGAGEQISESRSASAWCNRLGVRSVAGPGIALRPKRTGWTVHGTGGRVEVTGFDGSPGVLDGFGDAVNPVLTDVDVEGFDGWLLGFGQHEETQPDFPVRHQASGEFTVKQQL